MLKFNENNFYVFIYNFYYHNLEFIITALWLCRICKKSYPYCNYIILYKFCAYLNAYIWKALHLRKTAHVSSAKDLSKKYYGNIEI